jgi:multicomponent Na+:H+ antiporter subunit E
LLHRSGYTMTAHQRSPLTVLFRLAVYALVWLALTAAEPASWIVGAPVVLLATWTSLRLRPPGGVRPSISGALAFVPFFLWQSVKGGLDVALRVMRPRMRVAPGIRTYRLRLVTPAARVLFLNSMSLLPGTLSADLRGNRLIVHALNVHRGETLQAEIARLECRVAALFGEVLETAANPGSRREYSRGAT